MPQVSFCATCKQLWTSDKTCTLKYGNVGPANLAGGDVAQIEPSTNCASIPKDVADVTASSTVSVHKATAVARTNTLALQQDMAHDGIPTMDS